ncbi:hypothetical protein AAZV13_12G204200 [Glycine max]|uniref:G-type lectin S-receptor-like serine/threonine-protein kinase LECRK1 n=1 Tax=Glycine soja TaxID=3848 RepID=A0A445HUQ6_GLYSO|nr:G-type lectin S-receptor-like serine/threonine-protein kinase LECRK1 [Glycine soja]
MCFYLLPCFIFYHKRPLINPKLSATTIRYFTYKELEEATTGFKQMLGHGAFGTVYRGVLTSDTSRYVAVKRLDKEVPEGQKEFKTEVNVIGQTHHRNLVNVMKGSILFWCMSTCAMAPCLAFSLGSQGLIGTKECKLRWELQEISHICMKVQHSDHSL